MTGFRLYPQFDQMDCGPACLQMIARHYGKYYSLQTLRKRCFITREGVSMLGISDAAESIGFRTLGVKLTLKQLREDVPLPCILHWRGNHFVVLYKVKRGKNPRYYIADPANAKTAVYTEEELRQCWVSGLTTEKDPNGLALLLEPTPAFGEEEGEQEKSSVRDLLYFLRYIIPHRRELLIVGAALLLGTAIQLAFPLLTQSTVDIGINGKDLDFITLILIIQLAIFVAQLLVGYLQSWILLHVNSRIDISLISDFLIKLMKLPVRYFDTKMTGDIMQRIGDHSRIKSLLMGSGLNILFAVFNFIVFGALLGYYHPLILCIFLAGNSLYALWVCAFLKYRRELDIKRFNQSAAERSNVIQLIQGMQEIKLANCEKQKRWEWERIQAKLFRISLRGMAIGQIQQTGTVLFTQTTYFIISFIAAKSVVEGDMTLGMMMSMTYILGQVSAPIGQFISFVQAFQDAKISVERLNEIHRQDDEERDLESKIAEIPDDHTLRLEDVRFSYSGAERDYALDGVTLTIEPGKMTAIVGMSGSGKTTLVKMLQGIYEPMHGSIKVGNTPLSLIHPSKWRGVTGSVSQDGFIFSDTIMNNIAVGDENIDRRRVRQAARTANIEDFIVSLPLGYATKIGMEGNGISAGQKQRILIARAVYRNPDFIFLDEATNSLDTKNERIIMENLQEFYRGKTVVVVAHRLSTVRNADRIIVIDGGKVVEEGTHGELVARDGKYLELVRNQLELNGVDS